MPLAFTQEDFLVLFLCTIGNSIPPNNMIFSRPYVPSRVIYLLTMVFACGQIDILCKKLRPGGSVLDLKILQEVLADTF